MVWFYRYELVIRLILAVVIGLIVGSERARSGHPAGMKTHIVVCLGAAIVALMQIQLKEDYPETDISRIIAQVISGIGFLGAGCILHDKSGSISGLTTAATLWLTACLGLACGLGYYNLCIASCIIVLGVLYTFKLFKKKGTPEKEDTITHEE